MASHSLGKVEAYLTVREILPETSKGADGVAWCEFSGFGRQQVCNVRVKTQVWITVSVYVLIAIIKKRLRLDMSLYTIFADFEC